MTRKDELLALVGDNPMLIKEVTEMVFLEEHLDYLRTLPQIEVHPKNPAKQRATTAAKEYIKYLQQYNNVVRTLVRATGVDETDEESPLRKWVKNHAD